MPTQIVYVGPSADGVEIAETGQHAPQGEPVEVETGLAERLLEQEIWARPNSAAAKNAKTPAKGAKEEE